MIANTKLNQNLSLPKLTTTKTWNNVYKLYPASTKGEVSPGGSVTKVKDLVQELSKIMGVKKVRAIAPRSTDIHWIEFEIVVQPEAELSDESWSKIQDLIIDTEWGLRDSTQEKWYFHTEIVESFAPIREGAKVVATSLIKTSESSVPKVQSNFISSNLKVWA